MTRMDNWKHRSDNMKCKTCMWFAPKEKRMDEPKNEDPCADMPLTFDLGRCRRHAPTMSGFPVVFVNDWCGDHKLNENAI